MEIFGNDFRTKLVSITIAVFMVSQFIPLGFYTYMVIWLLYITREIMNRTYIQSIISLKEYLTIFNFILCLLILSSLNSTMKIINLYFNE